MTITTNQIQSQIVSVDKHIEPALQLALENPLDNAPVIAQLTQLKQDCSIVVKLKDDTVTAIAGLYMDLPHNNIDFLANSVEDVRQLIDELVVKHPQLSHQPIFGLYSQKTVQLIENCYEVTQKTPEIKMVLDTNKIPEVPIETSKYRIVKLTTHDREQISHLYSLIPSMTWTPLLLTFGPYYGAYYNDDLVSIAGVQYATKWAAEIGNIVTHFKHRHRNLAYCCTKLAAEELKQSCENIFLCVFADNIPAIWLYEKMGFVKTDDLFLMQYYIN